MSGAEESPNAMETDDESHSGNKSPVIQLSTTAQKRRTSRQKKHTNFGQQHAAMRKARATHHERVAPCARSRSGSESSSPVCAAKKKGRKRNSIVWNHCTQKTIDGQDVTSCNYCVNTRWSL